ncbi:MAG: hypothetical protein HZA90_21230 [Verrucomicrobia bacterium]|nr:hypothetical protein [Verrucomicrobiota bacterium]
MSKKTDKRAKQGANSRAARWTLRPWHGAAFLLGALVVGGGVVLVAKHGRPSSPPPSTGGVVRSQPQPSWGHLEYTTIDLQRPDESIVIGNAPLPPTVWQFDHCTEQQLIDLFTTNGLTAEQTRLLTNKDCWTATSSGWKVLPPREVVRSLGSSARQRINAELRKTPANGASAHAFRIPEEKFGSWLAESGLDEDKRALVREMSYRQDDMVCFSDYEELELQCSPDERRCLAKAFSRAPALLMSLRVTPDSDIDALARYWGGAGRGKSMRPFLESLTRVPGGASVSVSHFFPAFARLRLYTYPDPELDHMSVRQDCYWTGLNFSRETPDNRFMDEETVKRILLTEYTQVKTGWVFGDLILLLENGQIATHLCVYVADDVVFTKNGVATTTPWVLMKIPDVVALYRAETGNPIEVVGLRRK